MTKEIMLKDKDLFDELVKVLKPKVIICLGQLVYECVSSQSTDGIWINELEKGKPVSTCL